MKTRKRCKVNSVDNTVYVLYDHHGVDVWVQKTLKGTHREHCLCFAPCMRFKPNTDDNCNIAQSNLELCKKHNIVTPVFECPKFLPPMND
jgi:hypothetical protein